MATPCTRCETAPREGRSPHCSGCRAEVKVERKRRAAATYRSKNRAAINEYQKNYMDRHPGKRREAHLRRYGITPAQYDAILSAQGGACALCGADECRTRRSLSVDHDHECCPLPAQSCGQCIRGLLCHSCNSTLLPGYESLPVERRDSALLNSYCASRPLTDLGLD